MKKVYEIKENYREISCKNRSELETGCTTNQREQEPIVKETFESKEEALEALKKYETDVRRLSGGAGSYYAVTEYYVEENTYDEDGEWEEGGNIWEFTTMPEVEN